MAQEKAKGVKMVEIGEKPDVLRIAKARGTIRLRESTVQRILKGEIKKGDVVSVAQLAAIMAVKKTPEIVPLCHPIPITGVDVNFSFEENRVIVEVEVRSVGKTGVEMEALTGVSAALLAVWDMVKAYEKDEKGEYPSTVIEEIKVLKKIKKGLLESKKF
ncbi:MAG: cyclic pyranopterin monophosphate synthase MoaC [Candidatus Baldrarchaeia archaeon]